MAINFRELSPIVQVLLFVALGMLGVDIRHDFLRHYSSLATNLDFEKRRGMTMFGPHRDDLEISTGGNRIRSFGSQGQQRTADGRFGIDVEMIQLFEGESPQRGGLSGFAAR